MASTYSTNLKIELIGTGEQSGTWGTTTNGNLGTALEESIVGYGNPNFSSDANLTISLTDTYTTQTARCFALNVTSGVSLTATRNLVVPTIQKQYLIRNNTTGGQSIVVKTSGGSGVTVPNGVYTLVYVDGTNVVSQITQLPSLALATALAATSGGTGQSSYAVGDLLYASTTTALSKLADVATGNALLSGGVGVAPAWGQVGLTTHVTGTLPVANGGTGTSSTTYCSLTTNVTGTLPVANGGTGAATLTANNVLLGNGTSAVQVVAPGTTGNALVSNGTTWTSSAAFVPKDVGNIGVGAFVSGAATGDISAGSTTSDFAAFLGIDYSTPQSNYSSVLSGTWRNVSGGTAPGRNASGNAGAATFQRIS